MKDEYGGNVPQEFIGLRSILEQEIIKRVLIRGIIHALNMENFVMHYLITKFIDIN